MSTKGEAQQQDDNSPRERENLKRPVSHEEIVKVPFAEGELEKTFRIGTMKYRDIFAWGPEDMPGINISVAWDKLHVDSMYVPVKQKKRIYSDEKNQAVRNEVDLLLKAGVISELQFLEWIANVVLVKKPNGTWRMCRDFTSLHKACPKDFCPLPCLARLVDGSAGHEVFDFMDALRGYYHIKMYPEDEENIAFTIEYGLYCGR
ncbi:hypothetical protein LIER_03187 [Lithospermum erythrorhizon]|uniref:Transposon Ty3-I Gag-Pol polyprotein n=1 Tax=Lithospermum erythrorhizon TaxID=34254 RepID=A0AAV3NTW9_LITER